jgi:DNA-binding LacI/PurR family transcriptional regulator
MLAQLKRASSIKPVQAALAWINGWPDPKQLRSWVDFELYWQGASKAAQKFGYRLEEFLVNENIAPARLQQILLARNISGILIPPHGRYFASGPGIDWSAFDWGQFSAVRFGHTIGLQVHSITSDQMANGMMAFNKIRERGYQRIAFVGRADQGRYFGAGFLWAQNQLPRNERLPIFLFPEPEHPEKTQRDFISWLKKTKPDAIFHDVNGLPQMLQKAGYRVPEDIGVAGTTVLIPGENAIDAGLDQNSEEIGRMAVLAVLSLISDNARGLPQIPRQLLVQGRWVDGASLPVKKSR